MRGGGCLGLALVCAAGCRAEAERVEVVVFAASSLSEAFGELERGFEAVHPEVDLRMNFAGSQVLRLQIEQGAAAELFASANEEHVRALADAGEVADSRIFADNELALVVPLANPAGIEAFDELDEARRVVVGTPEVPVGRYTRELLEAARAELGEAFVDAVRGHVVSEESNVRLVRAKLELGEADAAFVYRSDALGSEALRIVAIPEGLEVRARYPIATLTRARHPKQAAAFVDYLRSPAGREILARHGFGTEVE